MKAREVIARELEPRAYAYRGNILTDDSKRQVALCRSDAILAALAREGLAVAPVEPTEVMCMAHAQKPWDDWTAYDLYRAMLATAIREQNHDE